MFVLKQLLKFLVLPPSCWLLLLLAVLLFWKRQWGRKFLAGVVTAIYLFHSFIVSAGLSWLLESRYKLLLDPRSIGSYDAIVTLSPARSLPAA